MIDEANGKAREVAASEDEVQLLKLKLEEVIIFIIISYNRTAHIRHQCKKTNCLKLSQMSD
jgi:hypothetical protein